MGQVELVKSRTIAEIAAIRETKLGNEGIEVRDIVIYKCRGNVYKRFDPRG